MLYRILRLLAALLSRSLFNLKVSGSENIPKSGAFILASNHTSNLDPVIIGVASPRMLYYIAKEELFENRFTGWLLHRINVLPIKRNAQDFETIRKALKILKDGAALAIFPEGRRSTNGEIGVPYAGLGFLASKTKAPIIPTFIIGTDKVLPRGRVFPRLHQVSVLFGKALALRQNSLSSRDYKGIGEEAINAIVRLKETAKV